jgi:MFS family permease
MLFASNIIKKLSSKKTVMYAGVTQGFLWLVIPFITELYFFMFFAFIFGCCYGIYEVAINLQASQIEKREGRSMMSGFHAFFSLGILAGSFITSFFLEWQISFFINILIYVIVMLPLSFIFANFLDNDETVSENNKSNIFFMWPLILFFLAILSMTDALTEGGVDAWAALYMRDIVGAKGFTIGIATISFNLFMVIGRLIGDNLRDRLGVHSFLIILISLCIAGLLIIFIYSSIVSSIIGFGVLGLGASSIVPLAYSIAGKIKGVDSAVGITIISISVYGIFMIAPGLMGFIAQSFGVNYVFSPIIILFVIIFIPIIIFKKKFNV